MFLQRVKILVEIPDKDAKVINGIMLALNVWMDMLIKSSIFLPVLMFPLMNVFHLRTIIVMLLIRKLYGAIYAKKDIKI